MKCPFCGEPVSPRAEQCPSCEKYLDDEVEPVEEAIAAEPQAPVRRRERYEDDDEEEDDRPRRRFHRENAVEPTDFLVPTNVSGWAIASCYMGLVGFFIPLFGLVFALPAFIFGIIAVRKRSKGATYGAVTSNIRAIIGLVLGGLGTLIWGGVLVAMLVAGLR